MKLVKIHKHSFFKYLLSTNYLSDTVLEAESTKITKMQSLSLSGLFSVTGSQGDDGVLVTVLELSQAEGFTW